MVMAIVKQRNILVGVAFNEQKYDLLRWALIKIANPGDRIIAVHVCRNSDSLSKDKELLDVYLEDYKILCSKYQVELTSFVTRGCSVQKVLVREAKNSDAVALIVGITKHRTIRCWASIAKYCAKKLPHSTQVLAIANGKLVFKSCSKIQKPDDQSEFGESEISESHNEDCKENDCGHLTREIRKRLSRRNTLERPGWPLLGKTNLMSSLKPDLEARKMTVVQWVMKLPDRSFTDTPRSISTISSHNDYIEDVKEQLDLILRTSSSGCKWFSYDFLDSCTSQFSSENLIGEGGSNRVYKGNNFPSGKEIAVKILKSFKEEWKDFALEIEIMTTLTHKNITPLLGICVDDDNLVSVYDYMPKGNLEENLHGDKKDKTLLSWDVRFDIAVGIAEALNYLHNECSQPVIHRDIKSSNILLSDSYQPQLSDFGLALWGPRTSAFVTESDVQGTFGYLAPEYFMYGKVSEKMDVYSFGVVLLELLSGKKPISFETAKGEESLVMWAKPKVDSGDVTSILDPSLDKNINDDEVQRVALAASLCLTRSARLRPKMSQILKILRGEKEENVRLETQFEDKNEKENDDEVYPYSSAESHLSLAMCDDLEDDSTSFNSSLSPEEYFQGRRRRSFSFDSIYT
jgi:serine/threonine protein kinase